MMSQKIILSLSAAFLLAGLFACRSSASPDEITPLYEVEEYPLEVPFEESDGIEAVPPDNLAEEPLAEEPLPEAIESEEPSPEIPVDGDRESLESLRESVEALRESLEALREALEALRETPPPEPPPAIPLPPVETAPPVPAPPPPAPIPPEPEPILPAPPPPEPEPSPPEPPLPAPPPEPAPLPPEPPSPPPEPPLPVEEPPPQVQPTPEPEPLPPEPEPPPPEPEPLPPAPPLPPPFLGPAEPVNPPPVIEPLTPAPLPELPSRTTPETTGEEIVFSRTVRVTVGQMLEIPFRGTGWVYLGELGNRRGINYESRRLDFQPGSRSGQETVEGQSFIFSVERPGTYILRFYRQDFIQDYIMNDYVQVIAGERDDNSWRSGDRVVAEPRWPPVADTVMQAPVAETERPVSPATTPPQAPTIPPLTVTETAPTETPTVTAPSAPPPQVPIVESPAEYVRRARAEFDAGGIEPALRILDSLRQNYPGGTDEAWLLYGQLLEANSPSRDIRMSLEYYRRLVNEFPFSDLVEEARRRIAYLERFYFNIR